jgi:glutathione peroxidase
MMNNIYDFSAKQLNGSEQSLNLYQGKVLLIVNVASQCSFTGQYSGLEQLYREFNAQGFSILAFPCNQFGQQEPGSAEEIEAFCQSHYAISFPIFSKIDVNGPNAHPLYKYIKPQAPGLLGGQAIKWNFTKFLIDRQGKPTHRYAPMTSPQALRQAIMRLLAR